MNSGTIGDKTYGERLHIALLQHEARLARAEAEVARQAGDMATCELMNNEADYLDYLQGQLAA